MSNLAECAQKVIEEANVIWKDMGLDQAEQRARFDQFIASVEATLQEFLRNQRAELEQLRTTLSQNTQRIVDTCDALGIDTPQLDICGLVLREQNTVVTECLRGLEQRRTEAANALGSLLKQYKKIKEQLGNVPPSELENSMDLRPAHIKKVRATLEGLKCQREKRADQVRKDAQEIIDLCHIIGEAVPEDVAESAKSPIESICVTEDYMNTLSELRQTHAQVYEQRKNYMDKIIRSIRQMYARLSLPESELQAFMNNVKIFDSQTMNVCADELSRLFEIRKREGRRLFHEKLDSVHTLWDSLGYQPDQCVLPETCQVFLQQEEQRGDQKLDEAVLDKAQNELDELHDRLQQSLNELTSLRQEIEKRETLVAERAKFDEVVQDARRLFRKGYNFNQEDKLRKRYHQLLPNMEKKLIARLQKWEEDHDGPFMYGGVNYLEKLTEEYEEYMRLHGPKARPNHLRTRSENDAKDAAAEERRARKVAKKRMSRKMSSQLLRRISEAGYRGKKRLPPRAVAVEVEDDEGTKAPRGGRKIGESVKKRIRRTEEDDAVPPTAATAAARRRSPRHSPSRIKRRLYQFLHIVSLLTVVFFTCCLCFFVLHFFFYHRTIKTNMCKGILVVAYL